MKILITGGAGFVASSTAEKLLLNSNIQVVLVDNFLTGSKDNIPNNPNCKFIKANVNNYEEIAPIMTSFSFDFV